MTTNFCDVAMQPRIRSNAVTVDGYEVKNLISPFASLRNKGFLVESFIKPPVSITLWFPINIDLQKVIIATSVGSQRSCALEIYSHSQKRSGTWLLDESHNINDKSKSGTMPSDKDIERVYACIGRAQDDTAKCFAFHNASYCGHREFAEWPSMDKHDMYGEIRTVELHSRYKYHLNNISHLVVRVTRATQSSSCAIRWLEVWGQPAYTCPKLWAGLILKQHNKAISKQAASSSFLPDASPTETKYGRSSADNSGANFELPEEFLDPLTCEMMLMPVLLPSGKTIDQSSLDRNNKQQAHWGHPPSDPFTGSLFSERDKPLPNNPLKARMDQFLLRHPDIARKYDFRVGRTTTMLSENKTTVTHSSLISNNPNLIPNHSSRITNDSTSSGSCAVTAISPTKRKHCDDQRFPASKTCRLDLGNQVCMQVATTKQSPPVCTTDLDSALKYTLAGLPSFLHGQNPQQPTTNSPVCVFCRKESATSQLYRLVCCHPLCRMCLQINCVDIDSVSCVVCAKCQQVTEKINIIKAHI